MPSALDLMLQECLDELVGDNKAFTLGSHVVRGVEMPIIANAPATLPDYFAYYAAQHGDTLFIVDGDERLSFAQVHALADEMARALIASNAFAKGDRVGIAMRNASAWIISYMAIIMAGGVATLLNGWWQAPELADGINLTDCRLIFADAPRAARLSECTLTNDVRVITLDLALPVREALAPVIAMAANTGAATLPTLTGDDVATLLFTSGSTGQSKGAWSTHRAVVQAVFSYYIQSATVFSVLAKAGHPPSGQPATLLNLPLFHVTGEVPVFLQSMALGRKLVLMPKWDAEEAMRLIEAERITYFVGVPLMSYEMLIHPNRAKYDLSSCRSYAAGGAPRPPEHVRRLGSEMGGGQPILGYGLTETNAAGCGIFNDNYQAKPTSTGAPALPLIDLAILDDAGQPLPRGSVGEVTIRSVVNFGGYWNNPEATDAAFTADGRFRTGDLGYMDEDDYLFIVDRKKDIIIRGGENISCPEVEAAIYAQPAIAECSVFGLPDERFGEIVGAVVRYKAEEAMTDDALRAALGAQLAAFKVPAVIWTASEPLPVLGTGKLDRVAIRRTYRERYESSISA